MANSVGRDPAFAQPNAQQLTSAEDISTVEDVMWEDVKDGESQEIGENQVIEEVENNQTSDHHEPY